MIRSSTTGLLRPLTMMLWTIAALRAPAQTSSQTLQLQEGWNAVHLRVTPQASSVAAVFAGTPVEVVSSWYPEKQQVASLQDPAAEPWKSAEWRTWLADGRAGAFLNNLHALESGRSYLIKASTAATITVAGTLTLDRLAWHAQSFNLTGLPADPETPINDRGLLCLLSSPPAATRIQIKCWQVAVRASHRGDRSVRCLLDLVRRGI